MKYKINKLTAILALGLVIASTQTQAQVIEERTYDDLVQELSAKRNQVVRSQQVRETQPIDNLAMHASLGLLSSINQLQTSDSSGDRNFARAMNGFQMAAGIELFSPRWAFEASLRNFGTTNSGNESRSLREFDLKVFNRSLTQNKDLRYRVGTGLGTRFLRFSDSDRGVDINESVPAWMMTAAAESVLSSSLSMVIEAGFRTALIDRSVDRSSFDIGLRLDTYF